MKGVPAGLCAALVLALAVLVHWPAAGAGFTYDDYEFVRDNASIQTVSSALGAWKQPFPPQAIDSGRYRPLTALSYALDVALGGRSSQVFHTSNLVLYGLCSLLMLYVSLRLLRSWPAAMFATLIFVLHPVHCEVVDSVSGRSELLALLFALATLAAFERRAMVLSVAAYACALFAKETGIMTLGVLAAFYAITGGFEPRAVVRGWLRLWPWLLVTLVYLVLRAQALGGHLGGPQSTYVGDAPWLTRVWTFGRVLLEYARLLVVPLRLQLDMFYERTIGVQYAPSVDSVLGLVLFAVLLALLWALGRRLRAEPDPLTGSIFLGVASFLLFIVPVSHLIAFGALMAERFLFAPSFGICLALGGLFGLAEPHVQRPITRAVVLVLASVWLLALGERSHARAGDWHDNVALWLPTAELLPDDYRAQNNLARGYLERRDLQKAIPLLERSLLLKPNHPPTLNNLGFAYRERGDVVRAEQTFSELVRVAPDHAIGWHNLATLAASRGELSVAEARYQRALQANPNYAQAKSELAQVQALLARARRLRAEHPNVQEETNPSRLLELGNACRALGDAACEQEAKARVAGLAR